MYTSTYHFRSVFILTFRLIFAHWYDKKTIWTFKLGSRDGRIPLFSDIRILGYLGYRFSLDTWISGYLDIMDIWIHGYLDTWISVFFGYMDTWILWISIFFIIQILDILSKYPDIFGYFFKLPNVKKGNQIQVLKLLWALYHKTWLF